MRWKYWVSGGLLLIGMTYVSWAVARPLPRLQPVIKSTPSIKQPTPNLHWSAYGEQALGISGYGVLATHGEQKPLPTASTAKVMVALATLEKQPLKLHDPGPNVPISAQDLGIYHQDMASGQSVVAVSEGEIITEYQALQALLLPSANNIATTLTNWVFGSQTAYLDFANNYAKRIGMTNTTFADASGISPQTVSTPSDLVLLGETAMQNPVIAEIVAQSSATIPIAGLVHNFNSLLGDLINGIKTGNTAEAGGCFLFSTNFHGTTLVGAIMAAPDLATTLHDAPALAGSFKSGLQIDKPITTGQVFAQYSVAWSKPVEVASQIDITIIDWIGSRMSITTSLQPLHAPAKAGQVVGSAQFSYQGKSYSTSLVLDKSVPRPSLWWRLTHPFRK